jgi:hypothetical protein
MKLKGYFLSVIMIGVFVMSARAGSGKEAILKARSESGKVALIIKIWDTDGPVSKAKLVVDKDTTDLLNTYDIYAITDVPNHILTFCFQQKGVTADDLGTGSLRVWGIPSSFVKTAGNNEFNWRFKLKIGGTVLKDIVKMDGTFEWNP